MLLSKKELAHELRLSPRKIDDMRSRGLLPEARRLGRSIRWVREEITEWIAAGCPNRETFEQRKGRRRDEHLA